ncbi:SMAD/FHA domain-containing protein, partial [Cunninghamella echinulata]
EANSPSVHIRLVPNIGMTSRCFIFDIIDRDLTSSTKLKIGRYSERNVMSDRISFKSKVVSRTHAELWVDEDNKAFIKDVGSSSGTFVNRIRLSPSNVASLPTEVKDGDLIQLGVDYQGGLEPMYRSVKIRFEMNRNNKPNSFSRQAFQQLRQHL